jgi:short-subunit dehydrogenase
MGKVIIITGASSGIGLACARQFAMSGYKVVLASRNIDKLMEIQKELLVFNKNILVVKTDVSQEEDCKQLINITLEKFDCIDILINNAGISMRALFKDLDLCVLKTLMDTNFWGTVYTTKYALPHILKQHGSIVGLSSIAGFMGLPGRTGYSASKFAIHGFLETLRIEHMKHGLHVMIVAPGFTASDIRKNALGPDGSRQGESPRDESKLMSAQKVAEKIMNGISKRKRIIILTTMGKMAIFMKRIFPKLTDILDYNEMKREPNSPLI